MDNSKNTKALFRIVNLTGSNTHNPLPLGKMTEEIAESFAEFFSNKITKIQLSFTSTPQYHLEKTNTKNSKVLNHSHKMKSMGMKNKNCKLDKNSTPALKEIIDTYLPIIMYIVNMSLTRKDFITDWKLAIVRPLLKNPGSESLHKNYRPVPNLSFLSKLVEGCML